MARQPGKGKKTNEALRSIVAMYEAWGKPEKAQGWRAKLEAANEAAGQAKKSPSQRGDGPLPKTRQAIIDAGGLVAYTRKRVMEATGKT